MAYGEFGGLLPSETHFEAPGAYTAAAKAEAFKKASYLSQMDQFYAQLDESKRQFDLNLAHQQEVLGVNKDLGYAQIGSQEKIAQGKLDLGYAGIASHEKISEADIASRERMQDKSLTAQGEWNSAELAFKYEQLETLDSNSDAALGLEKSKFSWQKDQARTSQKTSDSLLDFLNDYRSDTSKLGGQAVGNSLYTPSVSTGEYIGTGNVYSDDSTKWYMEDLV